MNELLMMLDIAYDKAFDESECAYYEGNMDLDQSFTDACHAIREVRKALFAASEVARKGDTQ